MKKKINLYTILVLLISFTNSNAQSLLSPEAVDDFYVSGKNTQFILNNFLNNDNTQKQTRLVSVDGKTDKGGRVIDNGDDTFTYETPPNFVGKDSFTYTLCNDKTTTYCSTANVTITINKAIASFTKKKDIGNAILNENDIPKELKSYYALLNLISKPTSLRASLKKIIKNYTNNNYNTRHKYLYKADADLKYPNDVVLMYTGEKRLWKQYQSGGNKYFPQTFNTEHVYPKSKLINNKAKSDLHHLRTCDMRLNSKRGNKNFTDGKGTYGLINGKWYPGDQWKGDVARMIFYLNIMYNQPIKKIGSVQMFLKWHEEDPVSDFEKQRNNEIEKAQKNRNPFIDIPSLVSIIYK